MRAITWDNATPRGVPFFLTLSFSFLHFDSMFYFPFPCLLCVYLFYLNLFLGSSLGEGIRIKKIHKKESRLGFYFVASIRVIKHQKYVA